MIFKEHSLVDGPGTGMIIFTHATAADLPSMPMGRRKYFRMSAQRYLALAGAVVTWFAVISQFVTTYISVEANPLVASIGLFNYFTILTNITKYMTKIYKH